MGFMKLTTKNHGATAEICLQLTTTNEDLSAENSLFIFVISSDFKNHVNHVMIRSVIILLVTGICFIYFLIHGEKLWHIEIVYKVTI